MPVNVPTEDEFWEFKIQTKDSALELQTLCIDLQDLCLELQMRVEALETLPTEEPEEIEPDPVILPQVNDYAIIDSQSYIVSGVDVERGTNDLIVYTPARGEDTGTNEWGTEVSIVNNKVVAVVDRSMTTIPPMLIPAEGYVLSGHGAASEFLNKASVDDEVMFGSEPVISVLPTKVTGGYWPHWSAPRLNTIHDNYNLVYLFAARPVGESPGSDGSVFFDQNRQTDTSLLSDVRELTAQGKHVVLSVGGAGSFVSLETSIRQNNFLNSFISIVDKYEVSGIDWNLESEYTPDQINGMIWITQQLRNHYGPQFSVTFPPAPWRGTDKEFAKRLSDANLLDMVAPQYYDHNNLVQENYVIGNVNEWITLIGDASKVGVGFRLGTLDITMSIEQARRIMDTLRAQHPLLRGAFVWEIENDRLNGYRFANGIG